MFFKARLKLTAWYLLIIMLVSISFSFVIYHALTFEFNRILRMERLRQGGVLRDDIPRRITRTVPPNPEVINEAKNRLISILALVNFAILILSGAAGYFLAGKTLKPIKEMVDEQNRFITDSSHELRTPLTSLKSEIEVNLRDKKLDLKSAKKLLESNLEEVNNLQYLSDNLIKLTQYQKSNSNQFQEVNLADISSKAIKKVASMADKKEITIKNQIKSITALGNENSLTELLIILLDNAIKYSDDKKQIVLSSQKSGERIRLIVKDQGIGIDKKDLPHLFDRFYRADSSRTKTDTSGYGLGLSIAKQIVDKHEGLIDVESMVGEGTVFTITLPNLLT